MLSVNIVFQTATDRLSWSCNVRSQSWHFSRPTVYGHLGLVGSWPRLPIMEGLLTARIFALSKGRPDDSIKSQWKEGHACIFENKIFNNSNSSLELMLCDEQLSVAAFRRLLKTELLRRAFWLFFSTLVTVFTVRVGEHNFNNEKTLRET